MPNYDRERGGGGKKAATVMSWPGEGRKREDVSGRAGIEDKINHGILVPKRKKGVVSSPGG